MKTEIELMRAALTAIEVWSHRDPETLPIVAELRAAVERAEKQEAVGFEEWWGATKRMALLQGCSKKSLDRRPTGRAYEDKGFAEAII